MSRCATNLPWGYQDVPQSYNQVPSPEERVLQHQLQQQQQQQQQYANLPAALLGTLKREKKPFTYTPGGVNLSEVLEARLQKRMERKKKYMDEMVEQEQPERRPMLVVAPTYNTPLNMYSMENALETLEVQAQMAASRSPSSTLPRNYKFKFQEDEDIEPSQSKAFRVLQVMTDTDSYSGNKKQKDGPLMSEMRWSGLREGRPSNPSRFFHTLQKITGTDAEEEQDRQESTQFEKRIAPTQAAPTHAPPMQSAPVPVAPMHTAPARAPAPLQHQPSFGSIPKLKRPAAFLPKQQPWSYTRMPSATPVGTDF